MVMSIDWIAIRPETVGDCASLPADVEVEVRRRRDDGVVDDCGAMADRWIVPGNPPAGSSFTWPLAPIDPPFGVVPVRLSMRIVSPLATRRAASEVSLRPV